VILHLADCWEVKLAKPFVADGSVVSLPFRRLQAIVCRARDFVSDQFTDCRRFRVLTVIDDCARKCNALVADTSLSGRRAARVLNQLMAHFQDGRE
jgi:transposase InsO family protein